MHEASPAKNKETLPIPVSKLHILVHPGYLGSLLSKKPENLLQAQILFEKYKRVAQQLPENEIMIILIHDRPKEFSSENKTGALYTKNIKSIQAELSASRQAIILTRDTAPFSGSDTDEDRSALDKIKSIAQARGYKISPETAVEIFGETHDECVQEARLGIENAGFFKSENIHVMKKLTDKAV